MGELQHIHSDETKRELEIVVVSIVACAERKYNMVMKELKDMKPGEGKINSQKFWKLKKN